MYAQSLTRWSAKIHRNRNECGCVERSANEHEVYGDEGASQCVGGAWKCVKIHGNTLKYMEMKQVC